MADTSNQVGRSPSADPASNSEPLEATLSELVQRGKNHEDSMPSMVTMLKKQKQKQKSGIYCHIFLCGQPLQNEKTTKKE